MKSFAVTAFSYALGAAFVKGVSFLVIIFLASILSIQEFANFGLLYSWQQGILLFSVAGIYESTIGLFKTENLDNNRDQILRNSGVVMRFPICFVIVIFSFKIVYDLLYNNERSLHILSYFLVLLGGIILSYTKLQSQLNRLRENHLGSMVYLFTPQLVFFLGGVVSVLFFRKSLNFFLGSIISISIFILVTKIIFSKHTIRFADGFYTDKVRRKLIPYYLMAMIGWLNGYGFNLIIDLLTEKKEVAIFTFLYTMSGIILMVSNSLNQVWAPKFYNEYNSDIHSKIESKNNRFYGYLGIVLGIVVSIILVLFPYLTELLGKTGNFYSSNLIELYLILVSFVIYTPVWHCRLYYYLNSKGRNLFQITLLSNILGIGASIILVKIIGHFGIYIGLFVINATQVIIITLKSNNKFVLNLNILGPLLGVVISFLTLLLIINEINVFIIAGSILILLIFTGIKFQKSYKEIY